MKTLLRIDQAVVGYRAPILGPLSFELSQGEVVGLWGPNGSGKSTLLNAIVGVSQIFSGRIERPEGLRIAYQSQAPVRLEEMPFTGRELLHYAGADSPPPPALAPLMDQRVDRLSGGQFHLLQIWAELAGDAGLVLLDEPTNNLDRDNVEVLVTLLCQDIKRRGVLLVSHDREFTDRVCDRVLEVGQWS